MKEKNVWLSPEELEHLLHGSLQWGDLTPRLTSSKTGSLRGSQIYEKQAPPKKSDDIGVDRPKDREEPTTKLEGQPVIWLLGSVGLLTLSSWFYFVLFAK